VEALGALRVQGVAPPSSSVTIGMDVGQRIDPTAFVVLEAEWRAVDGRREVHFLGRHVERLPIGTPYPAVATRAAEIADKLRERTRTAPDLFLDATGVGTPVFDALKAARVWATLYPVFFNHGDRLVWEQSGDLVQVKLGKAWLVSRLQSLFQHNRLHLPDTPETTVLAKELSDYEIRVDEDANDKYGAFKVGTHDDLVTALGLACLRDPLPPLPSQGPQVQGMPQ
jgi:hypothetical protein